MVIIYTSTENLPHKVKLYHNKDSVEEWCLFSLDLHWVAQKHMMVGEM